MFWDEFRDQTSSRVGGAPPRCCGKANTGPRVMYHDNITLGTSQKHSYGLIWASEGLSRPQRPNQTDNRKNESCVWHVGAGWKRPTSPEVIYRDNINLETSENTDSGSSGPLEASRGQPKQKIAPSAKVARRRSLTSAAGARRRMCHTSQVLSTAASAAAWFPTG